MGKQSYLVLMFFSAIAIVAHGNAIPLESWFREKQKVTQLQLYFQEILSGPNATVAQVASAPSTSTSPTFFGRVGVFDDPIRMGPNPDSEIMGRAQGLFVAASLEDESSHMTLDLVFTSGEYNGSTLNVIGHITYRREYRNLSIVGGTGFFLLARGIARGRTILPFDNSAGSAIFQYNLTVWHF